MVLPSSRSDREYKKFRDGADGSPVVAVKRIEGVEVVEETIANITSNTTSQSRDFSLYKTAKIIVDIDMNNDYTDETITLKLESSADGTNWVEEGLEFVSGNSSVLSDSVSLHGKYYRFSIEVSGTAPDYTVKIQYVLK